MCVPLLLRSLPTREIESHNGGRGTIPKRVVFEVLFCYSATCFLYIRKCSHHEDRQSRAEGERSRTLIVGGG